MGAWAEIRTGLREVLTVTGIVNAREGNVLVRERVRMYVDQTAVASFGQELYVRRESWIGPDADSSLLHQARLVSRNERPH